MSGPARAGRYLVEVLGLGTVLVVLGLLLGPAVWGAEARRAVVAGVVIVAVIDFPVYLLVLRGLVVQPDSFVSWWGLSLMLKLLWFGAASAVLVLLELVPMRPYLLVLGAAFPVMSIHQVVRLVQRADARAAKR